MPQLRLRLLVLLLPLVLGACSGWLGGIVGGDDEPEDLVETTKPVVVQGGGSATPPADLAASTAAAETALAQARAAWERGDALSVVAITNRAIRSGAPAALDTELRRLRSEARASVVADRVVEVTVRPEVDAVARGRPVELDVVLRNLTPAVLEIPRSEAGSSDALAVIELVREDYDVQGHVRSSRRSLRVPLGRDLSIPPGGSARLAATVPSEFTEFGHVGFSVLELDGVFRPVVLRVGETEFFDALPLVGARVRVFLENYEPLALDPLASLEKALRKRSPPHVLTATELLAPRDRGEARRLLEETRHRDPELEFVIAASLARLDRLAR